jgi:hypothetical protein
MSVICRITATGILGQCSTRLLSYTWGGGGWGGGVHEIMSAKPSSFFTLLYIRRPELCH